MKIFKNKEYSNYQLRVMATLKKLLEDERTKIIIFQNEYCVINHSSDNYLLISDSHVQISNNLNFYKEEVPLYFTEKLKNMISLSSEKYLKKLKKEVFKNKTDLLSNIYKEL